MGKAARDVMTGGAECVQEDQTDRDIVVKVLAKGKAISAAP